MKSRLIRLTDLALALAEVTHRFGEKENRVLEIHVSGGDKDIAFLAARVATALLKRKTTVDAMANGIFVATGGGATVAFIDEKKRKKAIASGEPKKNIALPAEVRQAPLGLLYVAHPRGQRIFQRGPDGLVSQKTKPAIVIRIKKSPENEKSTLHPRVVKIRAGGLSRPLHKAFKASIKPFAPLAI